ncbi:helix-turn-helix domain-containing protein [Pediococcus pentosaceus]|uniref:GH39 family glycosyl hydrolase n=1 Tax=Pediococcus pentosaceus TaxID=1255 RepID=UPI002F26BA9A
MKEVVQKDAFSMQSQLLDRVALTYNDQIRILYCLSNKATVTIDDENFILDEGNILIINEGRYYQISASPSSLLCSFTFDPKMFEDIIQTDMFFIWIDPYKKVDQHIVMLKSLLNELIFYNLQVQEDNDFFKYSIFFKIMDFLDKHYLYKLEEKNGYSNGDIRAQQIRAYIRDNYMNRLSLSQLSQELYISEGYLSRFFKKKLNRGFLSYLNDVRLYHTVADLVNTDDSITDIAMKNGFNSISGFNQLFKKNYAMSPKNYRKKYKENQTPKKELEVIQNKTILFLKQHKDDLPKINKNSHHIQLDAQKSSGFRKNWSKIINAGNASGLLEQRLQKATLQLHNELGFEYLRIWNIFEIVDIDATNTNFDRLDNVLDFMIEHDMKPFFVLGPKPHVLTIDTDNKPVNMQGKEAFLARELDEWTNVLIQWLKHVKFRYGIKEMKQWSIELWKPNQWDNIYTPDYLNEWYLDWLEVTLNILKDEASEVKIGGCEFVIQDNEKMQNEIQTIIEKWKEIDFTPDFISIADYPYEQTVISTRLDQLEYSLTLARDYFDKVFPGVDIFVTEWNLTVSNRNVFNDTTFKGAYIIQNLTTDLEMAEQTAYWVGSDIYSEYSDSTDVVFGAAGLLTKNGIRKPSFFAFSFLNELLPYKLYSDKNCFVSTDRSGSFTILMSCAKPFNNLYYNNNGNMTRDNYNSAFLDLEPVKINLVLNNLTYSQYEIRTTKVDNNHGSILDIWSQLGYYTNLSVEDEKYLNNMSIPKLTIEKKTVENKILKINKLIEANTFMLINITPQP